MYDRMSDLRVTFIDRADNRKEPKRQLSVSQNKTVETQIIFLSWVKWKECTGLILVEYYDIVDGFYFICGIIRMLAYRPDLWMNVRLFYCSLLCYCIVIYIFVFIYFGKHQWENI